MSKLLADGREPIVEIPPNLLEPMERQATLIGVAPQARDNTEPVRVPPDRTKSDDRELQLHIGIFSPESEKFH